MRTFTSDVHIESMKQFTIELYQIVNVQLLVGGPTCIESSECKLLLCVVNEKYLLCSFTILLSYQNDPI